MFYVVNFVLEDVGRCCSHSVVVQVIPVSDSTDKERVSELISFASADLKCSSVVSYMVRNAAGGIVVAWSFRLDQSTRFVGC